ncbi:MAG: hypothetical protein Q9191_004978 [Dirinaria sp. TL-2023a]
MFHTTYDVTWIGYLEWIWTAIENDLALIAASAPALRPIFRRYYPSESNPGHPHRHARSRKSYRRSSAEDSYTLRPARKGHFPGTRDSAAQIQVRDAEQETRPTLPIQSGQEQELAVMESRIGSLLSRSSASKRGGMVWDVGEGSHWDDGKSGTLWNSEAESEATERDGREYAWPLPGKMI